MKRVRASIYAAYLGTEFAGVQRNATYRTVEGELVNAMKACGMRVPGSSVARASRTDKFVHAAGNVFTVQIEISEDLHMSEERWTTAVALALNQNLPEDLRVLRILPATKSFDPRTRCVEREYEYLLPWSLVGDSFESEEKVLTRLNQFCSIFKGTHHFHNFGKLNLEKRERQRSRALRMQSNEKEPSSSTDPDEYRLEPEDIGVSRSASETAPAAQNPQTTSLIWPVFPADFGSNYEWNSRSLEERKEEMDLFHVDVKHPRRFRTVKNFEATRVVLPDRARERFIALSISGDSFMQKQIRKMVSAVVAGSSGALTESQLSVMVDGPWRLDIPTAPGPPLLLANQIFFLASGPGSARIRRYLCEDDGMQKSMEEFKTHRIYPHIAELVAKNDIFAGLRDTALPIMAKGAKELDQLIPLMSDFRQDIEKRRRNNGR